MAERMMRVMRIADGGQLVLDERPTPDMGPAEVRVAVRGVGVNRADVLQCRGRYPAPPGVAPDVPGLEFAGEVIEAGPRSGRKVGDRVMGLVAGGAYADQIVTHGRAVMSVPAGMSYTTAAAIPEAFITAFDALVLQGGLISGERVLIHAAGSGVGTAAIQIVRSWGAVAVGTSRTKAKLEKAASLGLTTGIVPADGRFAEAVKARGEVDLVLDLVGGAYTAESVGCMALRGRLVLVGLLAGARCDLPLARVLTRRLTLVGTVLRSRPIEERIAVTRAFARQCGPRLATGALEPVVAEVYPMAAVHIVHQRMLDGDVFGKLVLTWSDGE